MKVHEEFSQLDLLAHLSHEMRTPLSAILGFAQLMQSTTPSPTVSQKRGIDMILQAGWHLEKLINMARDLALIESGALSLSLNSIPLAAVMLDCQTMIESQAHTRGIRVSFPAFATPCFVSADRIRLQQVLDNVLAAAIEHSEVDGVLEIDCEAHNSGWLRIVITEGVDESLAARPTRFSRMVDGLRQQTADSAGTHIGLLLARRLVELMGGVLAPGHPVGASRAFAIHLRLMPTQVAEFLDTLVIPFNASDASPATAVTRPMILPVIVFTAQTGHKLRALKCGAKDFISKPFDLVEVKTRIHNMLEVRLLYKELKNCNTRLERTVQERTAELRESEARFRCLTELAADWYWEQDETGNFTKVAGPVLEMLGIPVADVACNADEATSGWDEVARAELKARIAARQPFLDFILSRVNRDGSQHRYQVSGEPIFNRFCGYIGYRGVGVERTSSMT